jgi:LmbE family N-acetylglucosaminyl deacetylase
MDTFPAASFDARQKILIAYAHPDDLLYSSGLAQAAADAGQEVIALVASDGEASETNLKSTPDLGYARREESQVTLRRLEVYEQRYLGLPDGKLDQAHDYLAHRIAAIVSVRNIGSIATFGPDGCDGHTDHTAMYRAVMTAQTMLSDKGRHVPVLALNEQGEGKIRVPVPDETKLAIAALHRTQFTSDGMRADPAAVSARLGNHEHLLRVETYDRLEPVAANRELHEHILVA